jgi:hypothetical protein
MPRLRTSSCMDLGYLWRSFAVVALLSQETRAAVLFIGGTVSCGAYCPWRTIARFGPPGTKSLRNVQESTYDVSPALPLPPQGALLFACKLISNLFLRAYSLSVTTTPTVSIVTPNSEPSPLTLVR